MNNSEKTMNSSDFENLKRQCLLLCRDVVAELDKNLFLVEIQTVSKLEDLNHKATVGWNRICCPDFRTF